MQLAYKFRLYPTKQQQEKLLFALDGCRFTYNQLLEGLNNQSKEQKIDKNQFQHSILKLKEQNPELLNIYSKVLQYENERLFSNLRALSKLKSKGKKVGKLRFKSKDRFKTFTYNQSGFKVIETGKRCQTLHLSKIGDISIRVHRKVIKGQIKQVTIKRQSSGKWFASIVAEQVEEPKIVKPNENFKAKQVGIDLGLMNYVYDSDGNHFNNPKNLNKSLQKLKSAQQNLSSKQKGSSNRNKQKLKVAKVYEKIVNQRDDFLHKLSNLYVKNYNLIAIEDLNINGLIHLNYNSKNIMDASWSKFLLFLQYKAERASSVEVVKVKARGTTQTCSNCGNVVEKKLWNRLHKCSNCGLETQRDFNSAINILKRALFSIGQELPNFKPVEIGPLLEKEKASLVMEAGSFAL